jgi:alpha-beta hydrolase superfamily lysophospholipase
MKDKIKLNALLFKTQKPKGLIFFLHGNAGCIDKWGNVAKIYTDLGYDFFILDYRGYGKSEGKIENENQLHEDVKTVYNEIIKNYNHSKNIIIGYSLGTCMAAKLASETMPQKLILQAPYYSMSLIMEEHYSLLPTFLLNYKLETYYYLKNCNMPVTIFHGDNDDVIDCTSSIKLEMQFKKGDTLIILKGQDHNNLNENKEYLEYINKSL